MDAMAPAIVDVEGLRIGVVALVDNMPKFAAGPNTPGTNVMRILTNEMIDLYYAPASGEAAEVMNLLYRPYCADEGRSRAADCCRV